MALPILAAAMEALKNITELSKKVVDAGDSERYAKSVRDLNQEVDNTYAQMRKIIIKSKTFSDEEKLVRLNELAEKEAASKQKCNEAIKGNRDNVNKVVLEIFAGFITCGVSFAPGLIKKFKQSTTPQLTEEQIGSIKE